VSFYPFHQSCTVPKMYAILAFIFLSQLERLFKWSMWNFQIYSLYDNGSFGSGSARKRTCAWLDLSILEKRQWQMYMNLVIDFSLFLMKNQMLSGSRFLIRHCISFDLVVMVYSDIWWFYARLKTTMKLEFSRDLLGCSICMLSEIFPTAYNYMKIRL
jgi:hypothetical protein